MTDSSGSATWTCDTRGRMGSESKVITGASTFNTSWTYNSADQPITMTYPDGEVVNYTYNNRMLLDSVIGTNTYVASTTYDSAARINLRAFGNTTQTDYDYYPWNTASQGGRLQYLKSGTSATPTSLQNLSYTYDAVGDVSTIVDSLAGPQTQSFGYDTLNRLTSASATGGANGTYSQTYTYDAITGNPSTTLRTSLKIKAGQTYTYDTTHIHAVASQTNGNNYQYDANGNMIHRVDGADVYDLAYDAENHLVQVTKNSVVYATFTYDGDGKRTIAAVTGFLTRRFVEGYYEYRSSTNSAKYYFAGLQQVAMNDGGVLTYLLGDHLGSTSITTDANGAVTSEIRYYPFGSTRYYTPSSLPTRYRFTGQYSYTPDFGLYYYGARWYDPVLGRFTSPDTIIPEQSQGVQAWDRYAYTSNNPLRYTDPTGHRNCEEDGYNCPGDKIYGPPLIIHKTFHKTFQAYPRLPGWAGTTYSADESYTDFSAGGNPEHVPSLPYTSKQSSVPINDNPTAANNLSNAVQLLNQGAMGLLAGTYLSSSDYAQDVDINYSIAYNAVNPKFPIRSITGMNITNSTQPDVMNYTVDITNINGLSPSVAIVSAAPGETVAVPLPADINGPNYIGGINITIVANNTCSGSCLQSQNPVSIVGGTNFTFSPYSP